MRNFKKKLVPISSGSMADIAFLLLIFFMVATTLQKEASIAMRLPPLYDGPAGKVSDQNVLSILINSENDLLVEKEETSMTKLEQVLVKHLDNMISVKRNPYVNVKMHPDSDYNAYINVLAAIKSSIKSTKVNKAKQLFNKSPELLSPEEYQYVNKLFAVKITESQIDEL